MSGARFAVSDGFLAGSGGLVTSSGLSGGFLAVSGDFFASAGCTASTFGRRGGSKGCVNGSGSPASAPGDPGPGQLTIAVPDGMTTGTTVNLHVFFDSFANGANPASFFTGNLGGTGLTASYYNLDAAHTNVNSPTPSGIVFQQPPIVTRQEPTSALPNPLPPGVPNNLWGTVWTGFIYVPVAGFYQFLIGADDGMWFELDGAIVLSEPGLHGT